MSHDGMNTGVEVCQAHGCELEWARCSNGCDDGFFDEYERDPINANPGDEYPCGHCHGHGGYLLCPECAPAAFYDE